LHGFAHGADSSIGHTLHNPNQGIGELLGADKLTATPNWLVSTINHERMPVLLTREDELETWLRGSAKETFAVAPEYPADQMRIVQEGFGKEDLVTAA
jgi:putative SOS response-associated peptidase YedK